ncbi:MULTISPECIES: thiamine-phosphate kinase [unclassified Cyanobium]|uniref:thiamine-phosphate kinase n=1 Tax=unclassified Cyanobium TaxID=2627006 RepID=UPI0020CCFC2D|nr:MULTISPECIES: thiamine-phosphate kinase [unclassified Cyanobium]MCP9835674.1 thiamine-phosphate kinase [Cyanobium sp. La Preciosa 7G6]MCP9938440.1 thiamine-phosphate kinase [Cyanobium sp. Aljojuca 7A6]
MPEGPTLAELGETELIRRLGVFAPRGQFGDDAALLGPALLGPSGGGDLQLVVNTDVLVEDVHFSPATMGARDVGWRAAAANLSDLAAMGCRDAVGLTVGLVAPGHTPWAWVEGAYAGLTELLGAHGGVLLGGDCSGGRQRLLAITALGRLGHGCGGPIRRGDGQPGDQLVCTGVHGLSRLGLALLRGEPLPALAPAIQERAVRAHRRPVPRFDAVAALGSSRPEALPWRVAGCDSSDGLAAAATCLAVACGCTALLKREALPLAAELEGLAAAEDWCLWGGEDFELVLALEPAWATALVDKLPGCHCIGSLEAPRVDGPLAWSNRGGAIAPRSASFQHFN